MSTNALVELMNAVVTKLRSTAAVTSLVSTRVHRAVPQSPTYPCISVSIPTFIPWDTKDAHGMETTIQVDVWTRIDRDGDQCRSIQTAVHNALHEATLSLSTENFAMIRANFGTVLGDPDDGATMHGIQQFGARSHGV